MPPVGAGLVPPVGAGLVPAPAPKTGDHKDRPYADVPADETGQTRIM